MSIRKQTFTSFKVYLGYNSLCLASGTAFFYERNGADYLVTNWHNVTGRNSLTRRCLSRDGAVPNVMVAEFPVYSSGDRDSPTANITWIKVHIPIYGASGEPLWYEHLQHSSTVDVVAIPIPSGPKGAIRSVNDSEVTFANSAVGAGTDAFVLGFPHGLFGGAKLPIWKRGSIASEPEANVDGLPKMLIDSATRRGMSGAPVFAHVDGLSMPMGTSDLKDAILGSTFQFMGCYSGSLGREPFEAQLGVTWKEKAIEEIIDSQCIRSPTDVSHTGGQLSQTVHDFFDWDDWGNLPDL